MTTPNPACNVNGSPAPQDVPAGSTVNGGLTDPTGALLWSLTCISTDELNTAPAINATLTLNQTNKTFQFTAPATLGSKIRFKSTVGVRSLGQDINGITQPALTTTFVVNVATAQGRHVMCFDEQFEQDAVFGWITMFNQLVRATGGTGISYGDEGTIVPPPPAANWTHVNFAGGTSIVDSGTAAFPTVFLSDFTSGGAEILWGATDNLHPITASSKYTLIARYRPLLVPDNTAGHNSTAGIFISDGTKHISFMYVYVQSAMHMQIQEWTNSTTLSTLLYDQNFNFGINAAVWLMIQDDQTNRKFSFAVEGKNFIPPAKLFQHASGTFLTETQQGIMISPINAGGAGNTLESWNPTSP